MYADIVFTNPNWENEETGEKANEVILHFTASSCDINMQVEAMDAEVSGDPDLWTIDWPGTQVTGMQDPEDSSLCHYATKFKINKQAPARSVGLA